MSAVADFSAGCRTAEDLERLSSQGHRYELVQGELRPKPLNGAAHGIHTAALGAWATCFVDNQGFGDCFAAGTGFTIERDPDTVLAPDWAFVAKHRLPNTSMPGFVPLCPDLVLEVRSPSDSRRWVTERVARWLAAGARAVWDCDPAAQTLTVRRAGAAPQVLGIDDVLTDEELLPGFSLPLSQVFLPPYDD